LRLKNRLIDADLWQHHDRSEDVRARRSDPIAPPQSLRVPERRTFPHMSVADNIGITPKLIGTPAAEIPLTFDEFARIWCGSNVAPTPRSFSP